VDDNAIDAVVRRPDGSFVEVQVKARGKDVNFGDAALFAAIVHELRNNYWFVFYSERLETMWIMSSEEFLREAYQNKNGKNKGKRTIWFNGKRRNKETGQMEEHNYPKFQRYVATDFGRIVGEEPVPVPGQHTAAMAVAKKSGRKGANRSSRPRSGPSSCRSTGTTSRPRTGRTRAVPGAGARGAAGGRARAAEPVDRVAESRAV
jgi:hypothetical protein